MFSISGSFHILGAQPDGDSIHFTPDDPNDWNLITGQNRVKHNHNGTAQLRLDAIDALETHYGTPPAHQPLTLAHAAADELVKWLGFSDVTRKPNETVTTSTPETVPGFILTRQADQYGRCVSFVGRGQAPDDSGSSVFVDPAVIRTTANHHLAATGLAYPTYYRSLFADLRNELTSVVEEAREGKLGVWAQDATTSGATVTGIESLSDDVVIVPKLFRRLVEYLRLGDPSLEGFPAFLDQHADRFFILSTGHSTTGLDAVIEINGDVIRMTHPIEDLVFDEK
jgi:endonuclease YncB( thermonuclease family)